MYGERVHQAVLASGVQESGITVHLVDGEYDHGKVLAQFRVAVTKGETVDQLAAKIHLLEHENYPKVLNDLVWGRLTGSGASGSP
jgi:phosphoribosylglycinamide formyltransferase-1